MTVDEAIKEMQSKISAACAAAEMKVVQMSDEEARASPCWHRRATCKRSRMQPSSPRLIFSIKMEWIFKSLSMTKTHLH